MDKNKEKKQLIDAITKLILKIQKEDKTPRIIIEQYVIDIVDMIV